MNERLTVLELVSKTERVRVVTADGKYSLEGNCISDSRGITDFSGGNIVRDDGVNVAHVQSWSHNGAITIQFHSGHDVEEVSAIAKELVGALRDTTANATEEGGMA